MVWLLLILVAIIGANIVSLNWYGSNYPIAMGDGIDNLVLHNTHKTEEDAQNVSYRWTRDSSRLEVPAFATTTHALLTLTTGGLPAVIPAPRLVELVVDGETFLTLPVDAFPRRVLLLLPPDTLRDGTLRVDFLSPVSKVHPDTRRLGIRLDNLSLGWLPGGGGTPLPPWGMLVAQWGIVLLSLLVAYRLDTPRWGMMALAIVLVVALAWMTGSQLLIAGFWQYRLWAMMAALVVLVWGSFPLLERILPTPHARAEIRWLWTIALGAGLLRMVPILFPPFDSHDWYIHRKRIIDFINGGFIIYDKPAEFSKKLTIVPNAPYLFYLPANLLTTSPVVAMQWVYTLVDSMTTLLVAVLARFLGGSARSSRLAAVIFALFPLNLTALWWGFGPQVIGQTLMVLLALFVAQPGVSSWRIWGVGGMVFVLLLLSHVGSGILGGFFLAWYVGLVWVFQREQRQHWFGWGALMLAGGVIVTLLLYSRVIELQMQGLASNNRLAWDDDDLFRVPWTLQSLYSSYYPLGVVLPFFSLVVLFRKVHGLHRWLVGAWYASAALFFVIDLATGLQVRYAYFIVPLMVMGLAMLLDDFITHHPRVGWVIVGCLLGIVAVAGVSLWYNGIFVGIKPSLRGLTH
jgi:hypothetical protein